MSTDGHRVLKLPERLDAAAAGALYRQWAPRAATLEAIDLSGLRSLDCSGVALVHELLARAAAAGSQARLQGASEAYSQLCRAHRIEDQDPIQ